MLTFFRTLDRAIELSIKNLILTHALLYVLQNMPIKRQRKVSQRSSKATKADTSGLPPTNSR